MEIIAHIHTGFSEKFGVPRQSGLAETKGYIMFEPEYANPEAVRGLEDFSHIWIIWQFSQVTQKEWSPTVRPPRLGGNKRKGVFATRTPFRPNRIGLSCVELESIQIERGIPILNVIGADMVDGTPIYDIKPYIPYTDSRVNAIAGFAQDEPDKIEVLFSDKVKCDEEFKQTLSEILAQDPRPSYQDDSERIYGMDYDGMNVKFKVCKGVLIVVDVAEIK
ncbi:MAG: tRNA (N6-threonylcarbamoyladenosine(37)-N6)-methyltransferase TrmO [Firmicutes bacterium]|jgi:tRNA-Thr(GGU) m(6)t(6)A37 methyltransferase TsaA|nr:tRNA (N6-threonylcarbamoyladenosine(37)-N6)-methyltransferase TrmO [Bacillota bacterium]